MKNYFLIAALAVAVSCGFTACGTTAGSFVGIKTQAQKIEVGCASATTALDVLTVAQNAGKLAPSVTARVLQASTVVTPICTAPTPPRLSDAAMTAFLAAVVTLRTDSTTAAK